MPYRGRVHVIDDDAAVREALAFVLTSEGLNVTTYASGTEFLQALDGAEPGCVLTDVRMPGASGLEVLRRLQPRSDDFAVIVLTGMGDTAMAVEALKGGALDFLEKPTEPERLVEAVRWALRRRHAARARRSRQEDYARRLAVLTPRERDVLQGVAEGRSSREIAAALGISPRTVESYRANVMIKTGAANLSELVRMAVIVEAMDEDPPP